jgi:hypothetical protein
MSIKFYKKLTGSHGFSSNITETQCSFTLETTMKNLNLKFMAWKVFGNKPSHYVFTETL